LGPDRAAGLLQLRDPDRRPAGAHPAVQGGPSRGGSALLPAAVSNFIAAYGLLAVFVLMVAESCGLPFPSEVIMPTSGLLAATGHLNLVAALIVGTGANLVGSLIAYGLA